MWFRLLFRRCYYVLRLNQFTMRTQHFGHILLSLLQFLSLFISFACLFVRSLAFMKAVRFISIHDRKQRAKSTLSQYRFYVFFPLSLYRVRPSIQFTLERKKSLQRINIILACKMTLHLQRYRCIQVHAQHSTDGCDISLPFNTHTLNAFNERWMHRQSSTADTTDAPYTCHVSHTYRN